MSSPTRPTPGRHLARRAATMLLSLATLGASLAACSDASGPDDAVDDALVSVDLAADEGEAIAREIADFAAPGFSAGQPFDEAAPLLAPPQGCTYVPATGSYTCGATSNGNLTVSRTVTFFDASGATMLDYDPSLTASVRHVLEVNGSRTAEGPNGSFSGVVHRSRTRTVSGLAGAETSHTWNGNGTANDTTTHAGARNTRVYSKAVRDTATNVVVNLPRSANPWPVSGQVVHNVAATLVVTGARSETRTVERRVVVTFNGTASVPLSVGGVSCTLHLDTRSVSDCSR